MTAVAIKGARDAELSGILRQFIESCRFEPVVVDGKPRTLQADIPLGDLFR